MFASPDETVHMVHAQSISRGDFSAPFTTDGLPVEAVDCFRFRPDITADCQVLTWGPDGTQRAATTEGYPPLFHAVAAVPAVFVSGLGGAYAMRLWMAAVVIALVAWAGALVTRQRLGPLPIGAFVLTLTPTAILVSSSVNPSGLALASAMLFVAGVLSWHLGRRREPTVSFAIAVGAVGLALGRRDGVLWLGVVCLCFLPILWPHAVRSFRQRRSRTLYAIAILIPALTLIVTLWGRRTINKFVRDGLEGRGTTVWEALRFLRGYLYEMFGVFGWLDAPIGDETFVFAAVFVGVVVILGLVGNSRRLVLVTALGGSALLLSPVAVGLLSFPYLQGRYLFPVYACLMLVAGVSASFGDTGARFNTKIAQLLIIAWGIVQIVAGLQNLRRYAVGWGGSWRFVVDADWHPVTMSNPAAVYTHFVTVVVALVVLRIILREVIEERHGHTEA